MFPLLVRCELEKARSIITGDLGVGGRQSDWMRLCLMIFRLHYLTNKEEKGEKMIR